MSVRRVLLCVLALVAGLVPPPAHAVAGSLSFWVVGPDGLPVAHPYVAVSVFGPTLVRGVQSRGAADGRVDVTVPADDPVARARIAEGRPVDLLVRVFDKEPGSPDINAVYVAATVNAGGVLGDLPFDLVDAGGRIYSLQPNLSDFVTYRLPGLPHDLEVGAAGDPTPPDEPSCPEMGTALPAPCYTVDYPLWSRHTEVPVGDNYGAGRDMVATMEYRSTDVSSTSIAVSAGRSGFVEAGGGVRFEHENSVGLTFAPVGPEANKRAFLATEFKRIRVGFCWYDFETWRRHCQFEATYKPNRAHGNGSTPWPGDHDNLDPVADCSSKFEGSYDKGTGVLTRKGFLLTLGPGESWAAHDFDQSRGLHAQVRITGESNDSKAHIRRWTVRSSPQFEFHYMYVKGGLRTYDRLQSGGGPGRCPENSVGDAWTAALDEDLTDTSEPPPATVYEPCDPFRAEGANTAGMLVDAAAGTGTGSDVVDTGDARPCE